MAPGVNQTRVAGGEILTDPASRSLSRCLLMSGKSMKNITVHEESLYFMLALVLPNTQEMVFKSRIPVPLGRLETLDFIINRERPIGKTLLFTDRLALFVRCYEWPSGLNED